MKLSLNGKNAIITAAGSGIGKRTAEVFHAAGARVFLCDVDEAALDATVQALPGSFGMVVDVADMAQVDHFMAAALKELNGLDILVNNAGIAGPTAPIEEIDPADWQRTMDVNLNGLFYCTRRAVPALKKSGGGSIVNLSSAAGRFAFPMRSPYSATKWGVVGVTRTLSVELGDHKIRVNAILPGPVAGPRIENVIADKARARGIDPEVQRAEMLEPISLKEFVSATDIANMALYLCSDAGRHITGQSLNVDSGTEYLS
ncbi:MAG: SDR family oxidoreductase [Alphaproteobacteria bacterium]|nr:SDR family oxidoreductase [Alphaproteobacteria bacterium]MBU0796979.1 SDR family oxidoreductase [Alphaproteobacteria bacterium]MBU0888354.1 SDR family oxidoreductase [Alphaproteobacteria bacterium]MBU1814665.1 SDR family oxidoreductase [Alphaproteobacteria bacterium]MBU2091994.1 SDR family oxidoreductase [Alphaproteobacteria bacterium]